LTGIVSVLFSLALRPLSASESVEAFDDLIDYGTGALLRLIAASKNLKLGLTPWTVDWCHAAKADDP
jgi:hypothetical protein